MPRKPKKEQDLTYDGCYGEIAKPSQVQSWLARLCQDNVRYFESGFPRWAGNIWGHPGTGKTTLCRDMEQCPVEFRGKQFEGYQIAYVPLAQIEEMGDIHGLPEDFILMAKEIDAEGALVKGTERWVMAKDVVIQTFMDRGYRIPSDTRSVTRTCPPDWVPTEERPGILILDDANRAGIRIMKGIMQLMQDYRTIGWEVPAGWTIVCTGNPDRQTYLVTTVDDAIITRQRHITMKPDEKEWAVWATKNKVDPRGINFVLKYPECMTGIRTNLRTLTEFFRCIERYDQIEKHKKDVYIDGKSLLDDETLEAFMVFVVRDMKMVIEPEHILNDAKAVLPEVTKLMSGKEQRLDIMAVTCDRLYAHLVQDDYEIKPEHIENFQTFAMHGEIENDMRHSLMRRLAEAKNPALKKFMLGNKSIYKFVAESLRMAGS